MAELIGSVPAGKAFMRAAADSLKPMLLELGGKNDLNMYPDADLDKAVVGAVRGLTNPRYDASHDCVIPDV